MSELSNPTLSLDILHFFEEGDDYLENITIHELNDLIQQPHNINPIVFTQTLNELTEHRYLIMKEVKYMIQNDSGIGWRSGCPATYFITERGKKYLRNSFKYLDIIQTNDVTSEPIITPINRFRLILTRFMKEIILVIFLGVIGSLIASIIWAYAVGSFAH